MNLFGSLLYEQLVKCLLLIITRCSQPKRDVSWTEILCAMKEDNFPICKAILLLTYDFSYFSQNLLLLDALRHTFPIHNYKS